MKKIICLSALFAFVFNTSNVLAAGLRCDSDLALESAVRQFGAQSANGHFNGQIYEQARQYADEMANNYYSIKTTGKSSSPLLGYNMISHNGADQRFAAFPGRSKEEILATVTAHTAEEAAQQIVRNWYKSRQGHKESMVNFHDRFGYALARTPQQLPGMAGYQWFAVGLFSDGGQQGKIPQKSIHDNTPSVQQKMNVGSKPKKINPIGNRYHVHGKRHIRQSKNFYVPYDTHFFELMNDIFARLNVLPITKGHYVSYKIIYHQ